MASQCNHSRSTSVGNRSTSTKVTVTTAVAVKPVHTSYNVEATLSNASSRTILSTKSNVASTLLPFFGNNVAGFSNNVASFGNNVEQNFHPFDNVETNWTCSICFNFVEKTKFRSTLLLKWQQQATLALSLVINATPTYEPMPIMSNKLYVLTIIDGLFAHKVCINRYHFL